MKKILLFLSALFLIACGKYTILVKDPSFQYTTDDAEDAEFKGLSEVEGDKFEDDNQIAQCLKIGSGFLGLGGAKKLRYKSGDGERTIDFSTGDHWLVESAMDDATKANERCSDEDQFEATATDDDNTPTPNGDKDDDTPDGASVGKVFVTAKQDGVTVNGEALANGSCKEYEVDKGGSVQVEIAITGSSSTPGDPNPSFTRKAGKWLVEGDTVKEGGEACSVADENAVGATS